MREMAVRKDEGEIEEITMRRTEEEIARLAAKPLAAGKLRKKLLRES